LRKLSGLVLWAAVIAYVWGTLAWLDRSRPRDEQSYPAFSIHNLSPNGTALAYRYLRAARGGSSFVAPLTAALTPAHVAAHAVVFRFPLTHQAPKPDEDDDAQPSPAPGASPRATPSPTPKPTPLLPSWLRESEERWVRAGGRLILGLRGPYGPYEVASLAGQSPPRKVYPLWATVNRLDAAMVRGIQGRTIEHGQVVFTSGAQAVMARLPLGRGEIFVLTLPEIFSNDRLARGDHLALLGALAEDRPVYFDEGALGMRQEEGLLDLLLAWNLGPALALLALYGIILCWRLRYRIGPPDEDVRETRSDAVDLVDSLAELYDRALSRREAVALYRKALLRSAALRLGLSGRALETRVRTLLKDEPLPARHGRSDLTQADFQKALRSINAAFRRLQDHAHTR
jgi:hypothetical protein